MEKELNIAAILKEKPSKTKLYSPLYGEVFLNRIVCNDGIRVLCKGLDGSFGNDEKCFWKNGKFTLGGEVCLFPSKQMRDWSKFAWKKGDVLVNNAGFEIVFDRWGNDNYTEFYGKIPGLNGIGIYNTNNYTLQIGKPKPEFKDGDIVTQNVLKGVNVCIIKNCIDKIDNKYNYYARYNTQDKEINYNDWAHISSYAKFATDSEKQQLFDALAKENKVWNPDTLQIEDLPKKCEFEPFQKVMIRSYDENEWRADFFSYYDEKSNIFPYVCVGSIGAVCIPYNDSTKHLLGTTDEWKGGEG